MPYQKIDEDCEIVGSFENLCSLLAHLGELSRSFSRVKFCWNYRPHCPAEIREFNPRDFSQQDVDQWATWGFCWGICVDIYSV